MQTKSSKQSLEKIQVRELCPLILELGLYEWKIDEVNENFLIIYYMNKGRGNSPKPIIIPNTIEVDELLISGIGIYLGDGKLSSDRYHLDFVSKDKDIVKFMLNFFIKKFNFKRDFFSYNYYYKIFSEDKLNEWISDLQLEDVTINKHQSSRYKHECMSFQIGSKIFNRIFRNLIRSAVNSSFIENPKLRRAFLKGIFASEGGIAYQSTERYIAYIAFHFSHLKEQNLARFVKYLLDLEGIKSKIFQRKEKGEITVQVTNWKNYWKLYKIGTFDLSKRKKKTFLNSTRRLKFNIFIKSSLIDIILRNTNQRQLSLKVNILPSTMCISIKQRCFTFENLMKISEIKNIPLEEIRKNIIKIRVGNSTIIGDKDFVDFVFKIKGAI